MTEPTPDASRAPAPTVYDPRDAGGLPAGLQARATVVLLLGCSADRRWAAETALELSAAWAAAGRRVVLADLHLETPRLHDLAGIDNLEGVVDIFLYGASIARSAQPVPGRSFYLIPAGTYEPDADAIYHHPRWAKLVAGFRDAGATLVLFAPAETAELDALARWVEQAVVLGEERGAPRRLLEEGIPVSAVMIPEPHEAPPAPPRDASEADGMDGVEDGVEEEVRFAPAPSPPAAAPPRDPELLLPPPPERPQPPSRRGLYLALGVLLLALLLAGAGFVLARYRPDLLPGGRGAAADAGAGTAVAAPAAPPAAPARAGEPLPYSVQVIAYSTLPAAMERLAEQRQRHSDVLFFISPQAMDSIVFYKLLAGALPDTTAAREMREQLVAAGAIEEEEAVGAWSLIQQAPLAFDLGEFEQEGAARSTADAYSARRIPAYVLPVPYTRGAPRWQVYAGAYPDSAAAEELRRQLVAAGESARLVPRVGGAAAPTDPPAA